MLPFQVLSKNKQLVIKKTFRPSTAKLYSDDVILGSRLTGSISALYPQWEQRNMLPANTSLVSLKVTYLLEGKDHLLARYPLLARHSQLARGYIPFHLSTMIVPLGCTEEDKECVVWAKQGECHKNPRYMMRFCRRSCGGCKQSREPSVLH